MVNMATKLFTVGNNYNHGSQVRLDFLFMYRGKQVVYCREKVLKTWLSSAIKDLWISLELLGRFT
jgi:hypothetical protein